MAIQFRSAASVQAELTPTVTVAKPVGAQVGDVLVAVHFATGDPSDMQAPAGWLQAGADGAQSGVSNGKVWYCIVDGTDGANYTFTMTGNASCTLFVQAFSGVDHAVPVPTVVWGGAGATTTLHVAPSVQPSLLNSMLICSWGATASGGGRVYTPPAGMTEDGDVASGWSFGSVAHEQVTATSPTGTRTATCGVATIGYLAVSLALSPAVSSSTSSEGEVVWWIDPEGTSTVLGVSWGVSGRFAPPPKYDEEVVPGEPGARVRSVRHDVREFTLPLWLGTYSSEAELRREMRRIIALMDPVRGEGKIRVQSPAGDQREIRCRYAAGLEMNESLGDNTGLRAQKAAVVFRAHDPYWMDVNDTIVTLTVGETPKFFPIFPMRLTSSEIFTESSIDNPGDVEAWPVWTLQGPGSTIVLRNLTTGKKLELSASGGLTLTGRESLIIDTRPGKKTLVRSDGTNLWPYVSNDSSLWPLRPGGNLVRLEMSGSNTDSYLRAAIRPRYLTA